jgi:hypothetical protein
VGRNGAQIKVYGKITDAFLDLSSQRLDAVFLESTVGEEDFLKTGKGKGYAFVGPVFNDPKYYQGCGIAVQKGNKELLAKINAALKAILADGTYRSIERRYSLRHLPAQALSRIPAGPPWRGAGGRRDFRVGQIYTAPVLLNWRVWRQAWPDPLAMLAAVA